MTAAEAIKLMCDDVLRDRLIGEDALADAIELGIEALKRVKNARDIGQSVPATLLPGETED